MEFITNLWENNRPMMILLAILIVVIPFMVFYIKKAISEHPKGLIAAALSNMGERFGYYIMNAVIFIPLLKHIVMEMSSVNFTTPETYPIHLWG